MAGGLNVAGDESQLRDNELRRTENARGSEYGGGSKRLGSQRMHASALESGADIQHGFTWLQPATAEILVVVNGKLYTTTYAIPATWTNVTGTLETGETPSFAQFRQTAGERVYIADGGAGGINKYDGATLSTDLANTPANVRVLRVYNQRLFGVTGEDESVHYSALNDGDSLGYAPSGGGVAIVRTFGDQKITGLGTLGASLFLFHVSGISRFTGYTQDDIAIQAGAQGVTGAVGTLSPFGVVEIEGAILFAGTDGFYRLEESGSPVEIGLNVNPLIRSLSDAQRAAIRGAHSPLTKEVWWWIPGVGVLVYNYALRSWWGPWNAGWLAPVTTTIFESVDASGRPIVLRGDVDGWVSHADKAMTYLDNVASDDTGGDGFTMFLRMHRFFSGDFAEEKSLRWGYVLGNPRGSQDVTIRWATPNVSQVYVLSDLAGGAWGTGTWGTGTWGAGNVFTFRIPMSGRGVWCDFSIEDAGEGEGLWSRCEIESFAMGRRGN